MPSTEVISQGVQSAFLPQLSSMVPPALQTPQAQGMDHVGPATPEMVQGSYANFGELSCQASCNQYQPSCLKALTEVLPWNPLSCFEDS